MKSTLRGQKLTKMIISSQWKVIALEFQKWKWSSFCLKCGPLNQKILLRSNHFMLQDYQKKPTKFMKVSKEFTGVKRSLTPINCPFHSILMGLLKVF